MATASVGNGRIAVGSGKFCVSADTSPGNRAASAVNQSKSGGAIAVLLTGGVGNPFSVLLIGVIVLTAGLMILPALFLGPIVEGLH